MQANIGSLIGSPTFISARDAIIDADKALTGGANVVSNSGGALFFLIWLFREFSEFLKSSEIFACSFLLQILSPLGNANSPLLQCELWTAFAKRGVGQNSARGSSTARVEDFTIPSGVC